MTTEEMAIKITKELANQGKLLEAGWQVYRLLMLKKNFHESVDELKEAFYSGAHHIFNSMVSMMDPGLEETDDDIKRMDLLYNELEPFAKMMQLKYGRTTGNA